MNGRSPTSTPKRSPATVGGFGSRAMIEASGTDVSIFDGIEPDPTYTVIERGHAALQAHRSAAVLAIGGGSSIDAAKVNAAIATSGKSPRKLVGFFKLGKPMPIQVTSEISRESGASGSV